MFTYYDRFQQFNQQETQGIMFTWWPYKPKKIIVVAKEDQFIYPVFLNGKYNFALGLNRSLCL